MKLTKNKFLDFLPTLSLLVCIVYIVIQMFKINIPLNTGDGLQHFFIANAALDHPALYFDNWGKPFFTLLASPFSVLGLKGVMVLNILIFTATCCIAFLCLNLLKIPKLLQVLFPITLAYSYQYVYVILSGLTGTLAGFFIVLSVYFLLRKKWLWMAVCVSILPFCRIEGQLVVILAAIVMLLNKQYKFIPFLTSGFLIYAICGYFVIGDFLWYFHNIPYHDNSISVYGHGTWSHFFTLRQSYLGGIGEILLVLSFFSVWFVIIRKKIKEIHWYFLIFTLTTFFGILLVHAYLWRYGLKGSLGLTRVLTIALPALVLALLYLISQPYLISKKLKILFCLILFGSGIYYNNTRLQVYDINGLPTAVAKAAEFIKKVRGKDEKVYYFNPFFAYKLNMNTLNLYPDFIFADFSDFQKAFKAMNYGDFIVRDSHFARERGFPLSETKNTDELALVKRFIPIQPGKSYDGEAWNVSIYQKIPINKQKKISLKHKKIHLSNIAFNILPKNEYTSILHFTIGEDANYIEMTIIAKNDGACLNCDVNNGQTWASYPLKKGNNNTMKFPVSKNDKVKLYFWNPSKINNTVKISQAYLVTQSFQPVFY